MTTIADIEPKTSKARYMTLVFELMNFFTLSAIPVLVLHMVELSSVLLPHSVVSFCATGRCTGARRWIWRAASATKCEFSSRDGIQPTLTNTSTATTADAPMCETNDFIIENVQFMPLNEKSKWVVRDEKNSHTSANSFYDVITQNHIRKQ